MTDEHGPWIYWTWWVPGGSLLPAKYFGDSFSFLVTKNPYITTERRNENGHFTIHFFPSYNTARLSAYICNGVSLVCPFAAF